MIKNSFNSIQNFTGLLNQLVLTIIVVGTSVNCFAQNWKYVQDETYTYQELIAEYKKLQSAFPDRTKLLEFDHTDSGYPLNLFMIGELSETKATILINNAIHPGEPCGVDASLKLAYDLLNDRKKSEILENVSICIIPMYNIGGALLRGVNRINQNGPKAYGSRGNAQNLDLNRDFIKCDSKNAAAFTNIFHRVNPDVFVDIHTTNGYDYQYAMGLLNTQLNKIHPELSSYLKEKMLPFLYADMNKKKKEITPYVYGMGKIPEDGLKTFLDSPRYSSGYTTLFNTIGFITEAHKYKPYRERVEYSYEFVMSLLTWMTENKNDLKKLRAEVSTSVQNQEQFDILWSWDTTYFEPRKFKGYDYKYVKSELSGLDRLTYDRTKPFEKEIRYYSKYNVRTTVQKPEYYVVPKGYTKVIERLQWNQVEMQPLKNDTTIEVESYFIGEFETVKTPFEGHYLHYNTQLISKTQSRKFLKGDYLIRTNQTKNRYIVETLEPGAHDSFFNWNFFDAVLQQKEWFSDFAFEQTALEILKNDPQLKKEFELKKQNDQAFSGSHYAQLNFIFTNSPYMDKRFMRYPVGRIVNTK